MAKINHELSDTIVYLTIMQKYYPESSLLIRLIEHGATISTQGPENKQILSGISYYCGSWINDFLPSTLEETYLPLDCLTALIKWINNDGLKTLGADEKIVVDIYNRLIQQVHAQTQGPFLLEGVEKLVQAPRDIIIRGMLLNDPACPLFGFVQSINQLNLADLLTKELNNAFEALLIEYNDKLELLSQIDAHANPLTEEELKVLKPIAGTLDNIFSGRVEQEACRDFNMRSNSSQPQEYMKTRWNLFKEHNKSHQILIEELEQNPRFSSIQI
ncbi:hypothetical protein TUM19329_11070 [Legionella antarctica]|uniref:Uncharacterized protein n=1 Tax=Legionella antarctica TaxID=2708020 RepID=A0A6F8T454_9GAMM|nr:hypothetical protein [Legionella antarctica]BCA94746.1 hypothetical protein TUM19329_11070 [Legionella antarctica]